MFLDLFTNPPRKQPTKRNLVKKVDWKNYKMTLDIKNMIGR